MLILRSSVPMKTSELMYVQRMITDMAKDDIILLPHNIYIVDEKNDAVNIPEVPELVIKDEKDPDKIDIFPANFDETLAETMKKRGGNYR